MTKRMTNEQYQELIARIECIDDETHKYRKQGLLELLNIIGEQG